MQRAIPRVLTCLAMLSLPLALGAAPAPAAAPAPLSTAERTVRLVKLWGVVRYLHPYLAYRDLDWDAAFVAAVPKVRAARSREEYAAAVGGMLAALGDAATRVVPAAAKAPGQASPKPPAVPAGRPPLFRWLRDGVLLVDFSPYTNDTLYPDIYRGIDAVRPELPKARAVVVDLRAPPAADGRPADVSFILDKVTGLLVDRPVAQPTERRVVHSGYRPQRGITSGGYGSYFATLYAKTFAPAPPAGNAAAPAAEALPPQTAAGRRFVFLVNEHALLPPVALALQAAGAGFVVAAGKLDESALVDRFPVDLGEGWTAMVRTSELVPQPGWPGVHADVELPAAGARGAGPGAAVEPGLAAALRLIEAGRAAPAAGAPALPVPVFRPDRTYAEMLAPDLPHRLLAVARFWNVIHYFYPYLELIGDWDAALPELVAAMERAEGARGYALAVAEMAVRVHDNHVNAGGHPELAKLYGAAWPAVSLRRIEGVPVVVAAEDGAKKAGIALGDVIEAVDGEPAAARFERLARYVPASTPQGLAEKVYAFYFLAGADGTTVRLAVAGRGGRREVLLPRSAKDHDFSPPATTGEVVRILPGNVGYADLTRLEYGAVEAMFAKLQTTRALVLDMRGYPNGTAFTIGPRINTRHAGCLAQFRRREVSGIDTFALDSGVFWFCQEIGKTDRPLYGGKTVMLIDERAVSQSEHSGLAFEAANGTLFIGSPTAGANGDITMTTLPGGIWVTFSGHDVRHADGRRLQRVGLLPDVPVTPTIEGIRDGRDEVLERALRYLAAGK